MKNLILEACVETFEEAINAEKQRANRLELCSRLDLDGLTPDLELTKQVIAKVNIPVKVMIRPRGGDFVYDNKEFQQMKDEIQLYKSLKIQGVVFGILDETNELNVDQIKTLAELAFPLEVTIHKAIDETSDMLQSVTELLSIENITSILTSGGATTAFEGKETLKKMMRLAGPTIKIIPAGKITNHNLFEIHKMIGAQDYHGRRIVGSL